MVKFILIVLLIYFLIRFFGRVVLPIVLSTFIKRSTQNYRQTGDSQKYRKEGKVTIKGNKSESHFSKEEGEYVNFEEIKD